LTVYVLDSTVLIGYLRDTPSIGSGLLRRLGEGHTLATTCVNLVEVARGLRPRERRQAAAFLEAPRFLVTDREAAMIAGTARTHGAVLLTHKLDDFPMRDLPTL
jgi:predicted nucleic acid-binding protein